MLVKDLIKYLSRYNEDSPVWIESEQENKLLDIYEVTNGTVEGENFIIIIPERKEEYESQGDRKVKMSEDDFIKLTERMYQLEFCIMRETPICEGNCVKCLSQKLLKIIDCGWELEE